MRIMERLVRAQLALRDRLVRAERGASAVEYALLVGLIAIAIIAAIRFLGREVGSEFSQAATALT